MKRLLLALGASVALAVPSFGGTLLVNQVNPYAGYGYGLSSWTSYTSAINTAFGGSGNVTNSNSQLTNLATMLTFSALLIVERQPGDALTAGEVSNIQAYAATGRRVLFMGENSAWSAWDSSFLGGFGASYLGAETSNLSTVSVANSLTAGVTNVQWFSDGVAVGGTSLFSDNVATLLNANVLSILSVNAFDTGGWTSANNSVFGTNAAVWLASGSGTTTPEPGSVLLLSAGLGLIALRFRRRRQ